MTDAKDDAVPGPSTAKDFDDSSGADDANVMPSRRVKKVTFSEENLSSSEEPRKSSLGKRRKSSIIGSAGYVAQLVEELEKDEFEESFPDEERKPIRKQSVAEIKSSVKEVEADIGFYLKSVARMSISGTTLSFEKLPSISQEKLQEIQATSGAKITDAQDYSSSEWLPTEILGSQPGEKIERSWVGTYIVGKDYWSGEEEDKSKKEEKQALYEGEEKKTWYEIPTQKTTYKEEAAFRELKTRSLEKIEEMKGQMDKEFYLKRKERLLTAAHARKKPKVFEEWTDNFKMNFQEVAKQNEFSHHGTHISIANADKWLENADILDRVKLTSIHTGLCFQASGGSRNRGLSFPEFTHFLEMISYITGMPLRDIIKRLEVCLRTAPQPTEF